jgi:hypothetical protein
MSNRLPLRTANQISRSTITAHIKAPRGNKNALKHGRYTAEAIAQRRGISDLLRAIKALTNTSNG